FPTVTPEGFAGFSEAGFGKLAWSLRVDPRPGSGAWIGIDLRIAATDAAALARFRRYWRWIGPFSRATRRRVLSAMGQELGPVSEEARVLPGDRILPRSRFQKTHVVTIEAPPERVWPWLVQMGRRRGGWYSWDLLDNGGIPSASRIIPELQKLRPGDVLPVRPEEPGGFRVLRLEPPSTLVLGSCSPVSGRGPPWRTSWAFHLEPIGEQATRLTVRARASYHPGGRMEVVRTALGLAHEVMERRQLRNLRRRAEAPATGGKAPPPGRRGAAALQEGGQQPQGHAGGE